MGAVTDQVPFVLGAVNLSSGGVFQTFVCTNRVKSLGASSRQAHVESGRALGITAATRLVLRRFEEAVNVPAGGSGKTTNPPPCPGEG